MTQGDWENPPVRATEAESTEALVYFDNYGSTEADNENADAVSAETLPVSPTAIMEKVLEVTKARKAASERKETEERLAAIEEAYETIDALVDLLGELDYPGAKIVQVLPDKYTPGHSQKEQLVAAALWPLDIEDSFQLGVYEYCFGADKRFYTLWVNGHDKERKTCNYYYYAPTDLRKSKADVQNIADALNHFELPTEDSLLQ